MKTEKTLFFAEITDTYGGEANYCWARRYKGYAKTELGFLRMVQREYGGEWRANGLGSSYDARGSCIRMFIDDYVPEFHDDYTNIQEL